MRSNRWHTYTLTIFNWKLIEPYFEEKLEYKIIEKHLFNRIFHTCFLGKDAAGVKRQKNRKKIL